MHLSAKNLLLISSLSFTIPFLVWFATGFLVSPSTSEETLLTFSAWHGWLSTIGTWLGLATLVLGIVNWKK